MATTVSNLVARVGMDASSFMQGCNKARDSYRSLRQGLQSESSMISKAVGSLGNVVKGIAGMFSLT